MNPAQTQVHPERKSKAPPGSRLAELSNLTDELEASPEAVASGDFNALAMMIADAALDADEASLTAAQEGLQRLYGLQSWIDQPSPEQREARGRVLGMIDLLQWTLRRVVPKTLLGQLEPTSHAHRFLEFLAEQPGISNQELASRLETDHTEVSRVGRRLMESGLARKRKLGRRNAWEITPRGAQTLEAKEGAVRIQVQRRVVRKLAEQLMEFEEAKAQRDPSDPTPAQSRIYPTIVSARRPVTRQELVRETGLPERTVDLGVALLGDRGYIKPHGGGAWRDAALEVNDEEFCAIGVKIVPDALVGVVTDLRADVVYEERRELPSQEPSAVIDAVTALVDDLRTPVDGRSAFPSHVIGLGVEIGGHIDGRSGEVLMSPNWSWKHVRLAERLRDRTGLVTVVENDVNALAVHEWLFGSAIGARWFAVVAMADGVGCGLILDGQLSRGSSGAAGEIGHLVIEPDGPICGCGKRGCLEAITGTNAILNALERRRGTRPSSFEEAAALADSGDDDAHDVFSAAGEALGRGISMLLNLSDPGHVLVVVPDPLGQRQRDVARIFEDAIRAAIRKHAFPTLAASQVDVQCLGRQDVYGARGAASTVLRRFVHRPLAWHPVPMHTSIEGTGVADGAGVADEWASPVHSPLVAGHSGEHENDDKSIVLEGAQAASDPLGLISEQLAGMMLTTA